MIHMPSCACMLSRFSCGLLFATPWTTACQAPLSMGFSRQEYWSGLPSFPPRALPDLCFSCLLHLQADSLPLVPPGRPFLQPLNSAVEDNKFTEDFQENFIYKNRQWYEFHCHSFLTLLSISEIKF